MMNEEARPAAIESTPAPTTEALSSVISTFVFEQESIVNSHKKSIICFKYRNWDLPGLPVNKQEVLITGSEDCTVRVWNWKTKRSVKCFMGCFTDSIDSIDFHPSNPFIIFCSSGNLIYSLNSQSESILERNPHSVFQYAEIEGDINSLVVHPKKNLLAFSDDSYSIYLIPITEDGLFSPPQGKFYKSLRRVHSNIVYSLLFTDNNRKDELFSGGFDLSLCFWDAERGRPNKSITIEAEMKNESQTLNPPFVYAMQLISQGKILVVAFGDGSVRIYSFKLGNFSSIFKQVRLYHAGSLSPIGYKTIHSGAIMTMKIIGNFVITGGIDRMIFCHELAPIQTGAKLNKNQVPTYQIVSVWSIDHNEKIQMIDGNIAEKVDGNEIELIVTDVSNHLVQYKVFPRSKLVSGSDIVHSEEKKETSDEGCEK